jgi:hypothetical protein
MENNGYAGSTTVNHQVATGAQTVYVRDIAHSIKVYINGRQRYCLSCKPVVLFV